MSKEFIINKDIKAKLFPSLTDIKHVLVVIHGFTGSKNSSTCKVLAEALNKEGFEIITFDLPRHGDNISNVPITYKESIECVSLVDEYVKEIDKGHKISYFATSYGGYLLLNFLNDTDYDYHKIILRAPAVNIDKVFKDVVVHDEFEDLKNEIINIDSINIDWNFYNELVANRLMNKYDNNTRFLYVIQGKKDEVVNYLDNEEFFENRCKGNYKIYYFEDSKHSFKRDDERERMVNIVREIFRK